MRERLRALVASWHRWRRSRGGWLDRRVDALRGDSRFERMRELVGGLKEETR